MTNRCFWPRAQDEVPWTISGKAGHGTEVAFAPGNHDASPRDHDRMVFGDIRTANAVVHTRPSGERVPVPQGAQLQAVARRSRLPALIGSRRTGGG